MDASQMLMTKDDQVRTVERSAFRTVWSKVGWEEADADAKETPLELNVDGPEREQGRAPITVGEHLEQAKRAEDVRDEEAEKAEQAADDAIDQNEDSKEDLSDDDPAKDAPSANKGKARSRAASTSAGDSDQSPSPTDQ